MAKLKAKNRLHASRVDRIAIVDRPSVPDAQIIVYKRHEDNLPDGLISILEKGIWSTGFNAGFVIKGSQAAVDALANEVYDAIYGDESTPAVAIKEAFDDFENVVVNFLMKLAKKVKAKDDASNKLTKEEVTKPFARGLEFTAMNSVFLYFRGSIASLILASKILDKPEDTVKAVIELFKEFITKSALEIIANKKEGDEPVFEKAGRIISLARLKKIKEAISVLSEMVDETELRYTEKRKKEEVDMDLQELITKFETLVTQIDGVIKALQGKGMLLDTDGLKTYNENLEREKKDKEASTKVDDLKIRAKKLGLDENSSESDIIGAEKKAEIDAAKVKKDALDVEKKKTEADESRLVKVEKAVEGFDKITAVIGKKFGLKTSVEIEAEKSKPEGDVFGDAVKGKK